MKSLEKLLFNERKVVMNRFLTTLRCFCYVAIVTVVISMAFSACDKKESGGSSSVSTVSATNIQNGNSSIATVGAFVGNFECESGNYKNNGFKIDLTDVAVPKSYLQSAEDSEEFQNVKVSNSNAMMGEVQFIAFDNSGTRIGAIYLLNEKDDELKCVYLYCDAAFTAKGKYETQNDDLVDINCNLKKGFNLIYTSSKESKGVTTYYIATSKPSGVNYVWTYEGGGGNGGGGGGGSDASVRFKKEKAYNNVIEMSIDENKNNGNELASHHFGESAGTSPYYGIPAGAHLLLFSDGNKWYKCLEDPSTFNFQKGYNYTVVASDDGQYLDFSVVRDGQKSGSPSSFGKLFTGKTKTIEDKTITLSTKEIKAVEKVFQAD